VITELVRDERKRARRRGELNVLVSKYGAMWLFEVKDDIDSELPFEMPGELWIATGCASSTFGMRVEEDSPRHLEDVIKVI
jgi:hypothetical protein